MAPLIVAATIVVPVAAAENGPEVKGENYYARGLPAQTSQTVANGAEVKGENYYARGLPAQTLEPVASVPTSIAFQWNDAAVGAGSSLVVVGIAIGGYFVLRRRHLQVRVT